MNADSATISVRLNKEEMAALELTAKETRLGKSTLLKRALFDWIEDRQDYATAVRESKYIKKHPEELRPFDELKKEYGL
jgi:predicted DNA-binding protein